MTTNLPAQTISIKGADAIAFAQAQFSSRVDSLAIGQWQFSAWLDAQGRVRALFHLARCSEHTLLLLLRGGVAATLGHALQGYVFRAKVEVVALAPRVLGTGPALPLYSVRDDDDRLSIGCGDHSLQIRTGEPGDGDWHLRQLRAGWPWLPDSALDKWLAPALSLERLQATVTDKGCYPGQEIIARLHFRGSHKRHLCSVGLSRTVDAGEELTIAGRNIGCILDVVATDAEIEALAVLDNQVVEDRMDGRLDAPEKSLTISLRTIWPA